MENKFAGSQDHAARRRRRLVGNDEESERCVADEFLVSPLTSSGSHNSDPPTPLVRSGMVRRFLTPHLWKHACTLMLLLAALAGLTWEHANNTTGQLKLHQNSTLPASVTGLLLLFAGQLAVVIGWIRSQSDVDFRGRYRWWMWLAVATIGLGVGLITNTLAVIPEMLAMMLEPLIGSVVAAKFSLVVVPVLAFSTLVFGRVLPDMSRCFCSQSLLVVALLTAVAHQMLLHGSSIPSIPHGTLNGMMILAAFLAFASMQLHCRFVAYVCNNPPVARTPVALKTTISAEPGDTNQKATKPLGHEAIASSREPEAANDPPAVLAPAATKPTKRKAAAKRKSRAAKRKAA